MQSKTDFYFYVNFVDGRQKTRSNHGDCYGPYSFKGIEAYDGGSDGICMSKRSELVVVENGSLTALRYVLHIRYVLRAP